MENNTNNPFSQGEQNFNFDNNFDNRYFKIVKPRNVALCIIFSLLTCGIYTLYWIAVLNDDINMISGHPEDTSGIMVVIFSLLTCGIYNLYWLYKMGNRIDDIKNVNNGNGGILYLILGFFCSLIAYAIAQDSINKEVSYK